MAKTYYLGLLCLFVAVAAAETCAPGFILPTCLPCAPGHFSGIPDASQCQPCPLHTFAPVAGMSTCFRCPLTSYTAGVGATECLPCSEVNATYAASDPTACTLTGPGYNNIVQIGIGMVFFILFVVILCRYYSVRKKLRHLHFCETRRKFDRRQIALPASSDEDIDADPTDRLVAEASGVDTTNNEFQDEDADVIELEIQPPPLPSRSAVSATPRNNNTL